MQVYKHSSLCKQQLTLDLVFVFLKIAQISQYSTTLQKTLQWHSWMKKEKALVPLFLIYKRSQTRTPQILDLHFFMITKMTFKALKIH